MKIDIQGTDGAAAMLGKLNGATVFLKSYMPFAISCHCVAHKEALASKDVTKPRISGTHMISMTLIQRTLRKNFLPFQK